MPRWTTMHQHGVTVTELLVSLAVSAVLAVAAWPTIGTLIAEQSAGHAADRLAASLAPALARTTAAARRTEVRLGPIPGADSLDRGWQLTAQGAPPENWTPPFSVVALPDRCLRITLRATAGTATTQSLRWTPVGYSRSERGGFLAATFLVRCHQAQRQARLGAQGRIRICRPGADADCD
ncbi:prepilin-type N-terminal cleavage/methylation domain-containing protein [Cupriavidus pauculus]|uniref:Pilus assembly protein n=1 Tax=Cupriavidus pauculus TaxID=82633 RepID=A0A2N5CH90_9BURK|nr:prepilin-type N-terminal cleavage/methylation domain-containing protein [Cupriavidus pauculus]PLQ01588.1 pilus assembly protein [Cupriavidus pauculus]